MDIATVFTRVLVFGTLLGNIFVVILLVAHVLFKPQFKKIMQYVGDRAIPLGFFLATAATVGSFLYGIVTGYPACILCWMQRIFMYPLMFLFALAWWRKDRSIIPYALLLALIGGAIALYQWVKDMLALYTHIALGCPVVPGLPSCDRMYVLELGYITIPMIALNVFLLIIIVLYAAIRSKKYND